MKGFHLILKQEKQTVAGLVKLVTYQKDSSSLVREVSKAGQPSFSTRCLKKKKIK